MDLLRAGGRVGCGHARRPGHRQHSEAASGNGEREHAGSQV